MTVELLGRNGIAVQSAKTSADGRVTFASVDKNEREKKPVAYVARLGDDVSFIPYARDDRMLNFSRFDIDGVTEVRAEDLDAFIFTERGVYRPGDEMKIGLVVKQRNWQAHLAGLPLETEVVDARDLKVQSKKIALPAVGFAEVSYRTAYESPTGEYTINVYLVKNDKRSTLLGSTTVNVKEFLPDRMKIETRLSKASARGWVDPKEMRASIALANLYGTPASDRRVKSRVELSPGSFSFPEFRDYSFYDALLDENKERRHESVDLGEQTTDADGRAELDLQLDRFADATYAMQFYAEAFEGEGGRSITGQVSTLVSALALRGRIQGRRRSELHQCENTAGRRLARRRSAAQPDRSRESDAEHHRAGTRLRRDEEGRRQLRLRVGLEGAGREIREDRHSRGRIALSAPDGRTRRLRH